MDMLTEGLAREILDACALDIRDIDAGHEPFLYASGNWGPGYVTIKNLVGRKNLIKLLTRMLAQRVSKEVPHIGFVAGNVTGGMIPGWLTSEYLGEIFDEVIPYVYIRDSRKKGGQKELITGIADNPEIRLGDNALVVDELINFAETTCNSAIALREAGYLVSHAACLLSYENPYGVDALQRHGIKMVYLLTLAELLDCAQRYKTYSSMLIAEFRKFLDDPLGWQERRGLKPVEGGGTK